MLFFVPPAGSRRQISFEGQGQGSVPFAAFPAAFPRLSCWAPGPAGQMNVADPSTSIPLPLSLSTLGHGSSPCRGLHHFFPFSFAEKESPIDDFFPAFSPTAHWSPENHVGSALPGLEGKAGCLNHEAQDCHFTGWDLRTRGGRDQPKITWPEEGRPRPKVG